MNPYNACDYCDNRYFFEVRIHIEDLQPVRKVCTRHLAKGVRYMSGLKTTKMLFACSVKPVNRARKSKGIFEIG